MSKHTSFSSYVKWLENQVAHFHINRKTLPCRPLDIMKDSRYNLVPLHKRPDLLQQCCNLLNSEWKRSNTARLRSLNVSCDKFPTCLLLLDQKNQLLGHCKISLTNNSRDSVVIESFIIDHAYRSQGLGSMLLRAVEDYVIKIGIKNIYLMTKGQEGFYLKNGYTISEPIEQFDACLDCDKLACPVNQNDSKIKAKEVISAGPPPPPMPTEIRMSICLTIPERTFMKKKLKP